MTQLLIGLHLIGADSPCTQEIGIKCSTGLPQVTASTDQLQQILQIVFGIIGALAVLFIVIGGLRFVASDGDPQGAARARSTVIYALVGLLVSLAAEAIVAFVLNKA